MKPSSVEQKVFIFTQRDVHNFSDLFSIMFHLSLSLLNFAVNGFVFESALSKYLVECRYVFTHSEVPQKIRRYISNSL